ncbi:MAG: MFS transporter [Akkermansiaceae bacterium]
MTTKLGKGGTWWIGVSFFLLSMAPGLWFPALPNILAENNILWVKKYAYSVGPLASLISPLFFGAMADYRYSAQKLMGILSLAGAAFLGLAFVSLQLGWGAWYYLGFQMLNALISAPMWALLATVALSNVTDAEKKFPLFRIWGTIGWIAAGLMVSWLAWDSSAITGMVAAGVRVLVGLACFMMPDTPPRGDKHQGDGSRWARALGLGALGLLREKSMRVFLVTATLFSIPLAAFYMSAPLQLTVLGDSDQAASMTWGQVTEIGAMLAIGGLLAKGRIRWLLMASLVFGLLRYVMFAYADWSGSLPWMRLGIALHGPCYTFFFVTGQMLVNRRVEPGMRNQAQALFGTLTGGVGGLIGGYCCGRYFEASLPLVHGWVFYWSGLAMGVLGCIVYFVTAKRS